MATTILSVADSCEATAILQLRPGGRLNLSVVSANVKGQVLICLPNKVIDALKSHPSG
jgi:hypothetical protein